MTKSIWRTHQHRYDEAGKYYGVMSYVYAADKAEAEANASKVRPHWTLDKVVHEPSPPESAHHFAKLAAEVLEAA